MFTRILAVLYHTRSTTVRVALNTVEITRKPHNLPVLRLWTCCWPIQTPEVMGHTATKQFHGLPRAEEGPTKRSLAPRKESFRSFE